MNLQRAFALWLSVLATGSQTISTGWAADAPAAKATASAPDLKTTDQVLARWVDAIGGEAAVRKQTTRVSKGTLTLEAQGVSVELKVAAKAPFKRILTIELPGGAGEMASGYDGTSAWRTLPGVGLQDVEGAELTAARDDADFWQTLEFKRRFPKLVFKGVEKAGGLDCYVLEGSDGKAKPERLYFDKASGLIIRRDSEAPTFNGVADTVTYFEDYRTVDGIKLAFRMRRTAPAESAFTFVTTEVSHTAPVDDARFKKPETK